LVLQRQRICPQHHYPCAEDARLQQGCRCIGRVVVIKVGQTAANCDHGAGAAATTLVAVCRRALSLSSCLQTDLEAIRKVTGLGSNWSAAIHLNRKCCHSTAMFVAYRWCVSPTTSYVDSGRRLDNNLSRQAACTQRWARRNVDELGSRANRSAD